MIPTRRTVLAALTAPLAGCSYEQRRDPASGDTYTPSTDTPEPSTMDAYVGDLETQGIRVDSTMSMGGSASLFYYRDPDAHSQQIRTVALTFADHRTVVDDGSLLSFTSLSDSMDRHGKGHITRGWADEYVAGHLTESGYIQKVVDTYGTV